MKLLSIVIPSIFVTIYPALAQSEERIDWHVVDRFRYFGQNQPQAVTTALEQLAVTSDVSKQYEVFKKLLVREKATGINFKRRMPFRDADGDHRYSQYNEKYLYPHNYKIEVSFSGHKDGVCIWKLDGRQKKQSCAKSVYFEIRRETRNLGNGLFEQGVIDPKRLTVENSLGNVLASTDITIKDILIAGLGDSFASGEGNPDRPTWWRGDLRGLGQLDPSWFLRKGMLVSPAGWIETSCHRSLLNNQVAASMLIAAKHPHDAVTLLHLGCSGAEIFDGLVQPQAGKTVGDGQLKALEKLRCNGASLTKIQQRIAIPTPSTWYLTHNLGQAVNIYACQKPKRNVDLTILSIGGNDIGFAGVASWAILPTEAIRGKLVNSIVTQLANSGVVCPTSKIQVAKIDAADNSNIDPRCVGKPSAEDYIGSLYKSYSALKKIFSIINLDQLSLIHVSYPNSVHSNINNNILNQMNSLCPGRAIQSYNNEKWQRRGDELYTPGFEGIKGLLSNFGAGQQRRIFIDQDESYVLENVVIKRLANVLQSSDNTGVKWNNINSSSVWGDVEHNHGWCATRETSDQGVIQEIQTYVWNPKFPSKFDPYDSAQQRFFRTVNDSILTQFSGLSDAIRGTMHPTYRFHILLAEPIAEKAESLLQK